MGKMFLSEVIPGGWRGIPRSPFLIAQFEMRSFPLFLARRGPIIFGMQRNLRWLVVALVFIVATPVWGGEVVRLRVEDTIQPASQQFIERALAEAVERDADLVVTLRDGRVAELKDRVTREIQERT